MSDIFSKRKRSAVMSLIRSRGNKATELRLIALMRAHGITGWRRGASLGWKVENEKLKVFSVKPDFVFRAHRVAVFVDGCFWHGCPKHGTQPKQNAKFWRDKIARNQARDRLVTRTLRAKGWRVLRIWEHELARKNERRLLFRINRIANLESQGARSAAHRENRAIRGLSKRCRRASGRTSAG